MSSRHSMQRRSRSNQAWTSHNMHLPRGRPRQYELKYLITPPPPLTQYHFPYIFFAGVRLMTTVEMKFTQTWISKNRQIELSEALYLPIEGVIADQFVLMFGHGWVTRHHIYTSPGPPLTRLHSQLHLTCSLHKAWSCNVKSAKHAASVPTRHEPYITCICQLGTPGKY